MRNFLLGTTSALLVLAGNGVALSQSSQPASPITSVTCSQIATLPASTQAALIYYAAGYRDGQNGGQTYGSGDQVTGNSSSSSEGDSGSSAAANPPLVAPVGGLTLDAQVIVIACGASADAKLVDVIGNNGGSGSTATQNGGVSGTAGGNGTGDASGTTGANGQAGVTGTGIIPGTSGSSPTVTTGAGSASGSTTGGGIGTTNSGGTTGTGTAGGTSTGTTTGNETGTGAVNNDLSNSTQQLNNSLQTTNPATTGGTTGGGTAGGTAGGGTTGGGTTTGGGATTSP
jgi:hypothetical protein